MAVSIRCPRLHFPFSHTGADPPDFASTNLREIQPPVRIPSIDEQ
jgi:hypothetical protein